MRKRLRIPIRIKILVALLLVVTAVVSVITFTMANLFHDDKRVYIHDLISIVAMSTAEECHALLRSYSERLQVYARVVSAHGMPVEEQERLLQGLFEDFPDLVGVSLYREGQPPTSAWNIRALEDGGVDQAEMERRGQSIPLEKVRGNAMLVRNTTPAPGLPVLTMAVPATTTSGDEAVVAATISLEPLLRLAARAPNYEVFLADEDGVLLSHRERERVIRRERVELPPQARTVLTGSNAGLTLEYEQASVPTIGGFAAVDLGRVLAGVQLPRSVAYLASRELLNRLLFVALGLLCLATVAGLVGAHRITRPVARLSEATIEIAQGHFDVQVVADSRDEIGQLGLSFNKMAGELKAREDALRAAQAQLVQSEKMAAFGQLGAGIAHEVKNPLAGILGCAQLSLRKAEPGTPTYRNLQLIEKETRRCKTIIENLLRFARQEKAVHEPTNLAQVVEDATAIVDHQLEMHKIEVIRKLEQELPQVHANANQLQQVLMNLMINAQQAMEGQPGTVTITVQRAEDEQIEIHVKDTGPGMTDEVKLRLFEPFFTTKPGGKGTGLGLSVSYGIIKDHGGEIRVDSAPGRGADFVITLPTMEPRSSEVV